MLEAPPTAEAFTETARSSHTQRSQRTARSLPPGTPTTSRSNRSPAVTPELTRQLDSASLLASQSLRPSSKGNYWTTWGHGLGRFGHSHGHNRWRSAEKLAAAPYITLQSAEGRARFMERPGGQRGMPDAMFKS
mmetsp:Transcript_113258/g.206355  ORF Transcript_113258/g.206355 Transcript_113258/m.206355 type:complete len:134 (-) Transcript_113258:2-403(-)